MTGIFLIAVVVIWLCAAGWLTGWATRNIERTGFRFVAGSLLFLGLMILPVADEIIGGFQFRELCKKGSILDIDAEKIRGKQVKIVVDPSGQDHEGGVLPIKFSHFSYRDAITNEEYASYSIYQVEGGLFIRSLGISRH